jgi:hypothetical protein
MRNAYKILIGKTERMRLLGTTRGKYKDHISSTLRAKRVRIWSLFTWFPIYPSFHIL